MTTPELKQVPPEKNRGGQWVTIGDEQYKIPPLAFRALREYADEVQSLKDIVGVPTEEQMTTVEKILHSAISRNYPSISLTEVQEMLDVGNYEAVLSAALSIAGFQRAGDLAPGETKASTGTASTSP